MSSIISLESLNLFIDRVVLKFLDTFNLKPIEEPLDNTTLDEDNRDPEFFLRAILLLREILGKELPLPIERYYKELIVIVTLDEIRLNYIDYYSENIRTYISKRLRLY